MFISLWADSLSIKTFLPAHAVRISLAGMDWHICKLPLVQLVVWNLERVGELGIEKICPTQTLWDFRGALLLKNTLLIHELRHSWQLYPTSYNPHESGSCLTFCIKQWVGYLVKSSEHLATSSSLWNQMVDCSFLLDHSFSLTAWQWIHILKFKKL